MRSANRPSPAQLEDEIIGLTYAVRDALMARQQGLGELSATRLAAAIVEDLRRRYAGHVIQFPPLAETPAAR